MFILVIIVLILAKVYHQSSLCWDSGVRKARGNMIARAAVGLMSRELLNAVADPHILNEGRIEDNANNIQFITLTGDPVSNLRVAKLVRYEFDSGSASVIRREKSAVPLAYGSFDSEKVDTLVTNAVSFVVNTPEPSAVYDYGGLPGWVRVTIRMKTQDDVSGVGATSWGPDRTPNTGDDIHSY